MPQRHDAEFQAERRRCAGYLGIPDREQHARCGRHCNALGQSLAGSEQLARVCMENHSVPRVMRCRMRRAIWWAADVGPELTRVGSKVKPSGCRRGCRNPRVYDPRHRDAALSLHGCADCDPVRIPAGQDGFRSAGQCASRSGNAGADCARQAAGVGLRLCVVPRDCGHQEAGELCAGAQPDRQQAGNPTDLPARACRTPCPITSQARSDSLGRFRFRPEDAAVHLHAGADRLADHRAALA